MKALIDPQQNGLVCQVESQQFDVAPPLYWVDCPDGIVAGLYTYDGTNFVPVALPEPDANENRDIAKKRLQDSDFAVLPDVNLTNKADWEAYRSVLRQIATNPTSGNLTWPAKPQTIWG